MRAKQQQKIHFSEMATSPQSGAESDQKRKKSMKKSEKIVLNTINTDSENESFDAYKEKETKSVKTGKVRESAAYSEVKHQLQSANAKMSQRMKAFQRKMDQPKTMFSFTQKDCSGC